LAGHVLVSLSLLDRLRHVPHENGALGSNGHDGLLIRGDGDLLDVSGMADSLEVADAFIVVPDLHSLVLASRNKVLSSLGDGEGVDLTSLGAVEHSNGLSIEAVPVSDLPVAACGKDLALIRVVEHLLEHGGLEEAHDSGIVNDVPDDARAIVGGRNGLGILTVDLDV